MTRWFSTQWIAYDDIQLSSRFRVWRWTWFAVVNVSCKHCVLYKWFCRTKVPTWSLYTTSSRCEYEKGWELINQYVRVKLVKWVNFWDEDVSTHSVYVYTYKHFSTIILRRTLPRAYAYTPNHAGQNTYSGCIDFVFILFIFNILSTRFNVLMTGKIVIWFFFFLRYSQVVLYSGAGGTVEISRLVNNRNDFFFSCFFLFSTARTSTLDPTVQIIGRGLCHLILSLYTVELHRFHICYQSGVEIVCLPSVKPKRLFLVSLTFDTWQTQRE